jgi:hypothetical protein
MASTARSAARSHAQPDVARREHGGTFLGATGRRRQGPNFCFPFFRSRRAYHERRAED